MAKNDKSTFPDYISKDLFEKALRSGLKSPTIKVKDLHLSMGSAPGDNYCSDIYRARVIYINGLSAEENQISLIVKAMPFSEYRGPILEDLEVFDKEVDMYTNILPKLSKLLHGEFLCAKYVNNLIRDAWLSLQNTPTIFSLDVSMQ